MSFEKLSVFYNSFLELFGSHLVYETFTFYCVGKPYRGKCETAVEGLVNFMQG
jgi:hypothetical protein